MIGRRFELGTQHGVNGLRFFGRCGFSSVATGWETQLTIAVDAVLSRVTMFELCEAFFSHSPDESSALADSANAVPTGPPTRLRLRNEVLAGTWEALATDRQLPGLGKALQGARTV